jgi:group I intron endonuclease
MKIVCGIYKITSPTNKIYIGKSKNIYIRWQSYKSLNCKTQIKIYNSLKKHGVENHTFEIIHICLLNELNALEKYYINYFDCCNSKTGLNSMFNEEVLQKRKKTIEIKRIRKENKKITDKRWRDKQKEKEQLYKQ